MISLMANAGFATKNSKSFKVTIFSFAVAVFFLLFLKNHWDIRKRFLLYCLRCRMPGGKNRQKQKLVLQVLIMNAHHKNWSRKKTISWHHKNWARKKSWPTSQCDQSVRIFLDNGCEGSCQTKIAHFSYFF